MGVEKMAYNRPDPQVHHWFIPQLYLWHAVNLMLTRIFTLFAIFFMQLWGLCIEPQYGGTSAAVFWVTLYA
jgi:hypothetical protein